jgi:hypothetical protein
MMPMVARYLLCEQIRSSLDHRIAQSHVRAYLWYYVATLKFYIQI